ncbi:hybrid sensor histidine kinase/response regulator [Devosia submarina]|uniref:hybrid sensor histidine kinase/response regulator n=1 Tax=Devosia submarina TaxID=1173082 RepID=UPI000D34660A|nr:hybrid sensor histidine kinase/response regulator [Devosia submarina]
MAFSSPNALDSLRQAIEFLPQGVAVFDAEARLVISNGRYQALLDLPSALVEPDTGLSDILAFLGERGDLGIGLVGDLASERISHLYAAPTSVMQLIGNAGQALELQSSRLPDGGLVISFSDVTQRIEAERALERMNQSLEQRVEERTAALTRVNAELESARAKADAANHDKTRFLAAASHDLLQPLNAARLYTSTLIERAKLTGLSDLANSIEASLTAVEEIMSALLDISRIDSGALKPAPAPVSARDLLKKMEVEFGPLARERNIALTIKDTDVAVLVDKALVGRIVQNLVSNAIKYTPPGGRVLVGIRRRGSRMRLDVVDTGIGFNRDQHRLLFAEFSRLERGARMAQGLGLGLSIVQRLVSAMGLTLELDSREGKGSRFSLFLPATRTIRTANNQGPAQPEASVGALDYKVLCVDNERAILEAMEGLLRHWGCDVRTALSLKQIDRERLLEGWYPDLVLMDYHLDQTSGLDAIEWLRHNLGGHLPAALVTADRSPAVRTLAEDRGIAVVTKPVKPAALRAAISGLANQSRSPAKRVG